MPFRKFRSLEEMEDSLWREPGPALWAAIRGVWSLGSRVGNQRFPRGVFKHRSVESAKALREQWDDTNFRRFHDARSSALRESDLRDRVRAWLDDPRCSKAFAGSWQTKSGSPLGHIRAASQVVPGDALLVVALAYEWFASCGEQTTQALAAFVTKAPDWRGSVIDVLRRLSVDADAGEWARSARESIAASRDLDG